MYNWGAAVHKFLIQSLNRAAVLYNQQQNTVAVNLSGCVVVLQVSINHFTMSIIVRMFVLQTMCLFETVMGRTTYRIGMHYRISKNAWMSSHYDEVFEYMFCFSNKSGVGYGLLISYVIGIHYVF